MAYGSPRNPEEIEPYFTDVRGGRPPSPEALEELQVRYAAIGPTSGLNEMTQRQASGLFAVLEQMAPGRFQVFVGMKHWHPFISDAVAGIESARIDRIVGLVLAPHYSRKSIGEYESRVLEAVGESGANMDLAMVQQWYSDPGFIEFTAANIRLSLQGWQPGDGSTRVFFTAHSIPARIVAEGDPYADQLADSASLYAKAAGITDYGTGWQSASATPEPWLGPDILEVLEEYAGSGGKRALVAPVGFVSDHLEILYDIDIECAQKAERIGLELRRVPSPNDDPRFLRILAKIVMRYAEDVSPGAGLREAGG